MDRATAIHMINETFSQPFDEGRYKIFIRNLLNRMDESKSFSYQGQYIPDAFKDHVRQYKRVGTYTDPNHMGIDVLIVYLRSVNALDHARTMQRNFVVDYLKKRGQKDAALVAYVGQNAEDWRFSLVTIDYKSQTTPEGKVKVKEELTPARRYSFLVGKNEPNHTAQQQLFPILEDSQHDPTLPSIEAAFNIETVTKQFFEQYKELYLRLKDELDSVVANDKQIDAEFTRCKINTSSFAKRLLGQLVFLYFLQKKGWLGVAYGEQWGTGSKNYMLELFQAKYKSYENFFNDILEPLFYEALAVERKDNLFAFLGCKIPFLNGGLFEPIGGYDWRKTDILLRNEVFQAVFSVFNLYNFTIREDEPLEREVAVDPEMLGKVFENLLDVQDRKSKGAFYTPREIVHYMCQESLINYLDTAINQKEQKLTQETPEQQLLFGEPKPRQKSLSYTTYTAVVPREDIELLIRHGEFAIDFDAAKESGTTSYTWRLPDSVRNHSKEIDQALEDIRICDPAIGSGAFPVGMMTEIVKARQVLTTYLPENPSRTAYNFKRQAIENSIYGVDIDPSAVDIARLRLWLSLVVDEGNFLVIKPLPNLDYKIVCGNSLLGIKKNLLNLSIYNKLEKLKTQYFYETNKTRKEIYRGEINKLIKILLGNNRVVFDFHIFFSEVFAKGGFDLVITNPPYVGEKGHKEMFREIATGPLSQYYQGKMDLFYFFIHLAIDLCKDGGHISIITTNYFITSLGAKKLRRDLKNRTSVLGLINFQELKIFESAMGQHNMITNLAKQNSKDGVSRNCISNRNGAATASVLRSILSWEDSETDYYSISQSDLYEGDEYYIRLNGLSSETSNDPVQRILDKIKRQGSPLETICNIRTGLDSAADYLSNSNIQKLKSVNNLNIGDGIFVLRLDNENDLRILSALNENEKKLLKPFYKSSDIKRYWAAEKPEKYIIYLDKSSPDIARFPNIKEHLLRFKEILQDRREVIKGNIRYFELQWPRNQELFIGEKILVPYRANINTFGYSTRDWFCRTDCYIIKSKLLNINLKYVLALLNSKLFYFWFLSKAKRKGSMLELLQTPLSETPIKIISKEDQNSLITLVESILVVEKNNLCQVDIGSIESKINELIYTLYGLTNDEITIIENTIKPHKFS